MVKLSPFGFSTNFELELIASCQLVIVSIPLQFFILFFSGKSKSTVRRIVNECFENGGKFETPGKHRKGRPKKEMDDFNICALRQKIQFFYTVQKEVTFFVFSCIFFCIPKKATFSTINRTL